jgi:hypothetical protein
MITIGGVSRSNRAGFSHPGLTCDNYIGKVSPLQFPLKNGTTQVVAKKRFFVLKLVVKPHGEAGVPIFCKRFLGQDFLEGILRGNRPADGIFAKW